MADVATEDTVGCFRPTGSQFEVSGESLLFQTPTSAQVGYRRTNPGDEWRLDNLHRPFKPAWLLCVARRPLDRVA
jgi:hypothetical protein